MLCSPPCPLGIRCFFLGLSSRFLNTLHRLSCLAVNKYTKKNDVLSMKGSASSHDGVVTRIIESPVIYPLDYAMSHRKREPGKSRIPFWILHGAEGGI